MGQWRNGYDVLGARVVANERIINESSDLPRALTAKQLMKVCSAEASDLSQATTRFTKTESSLAAKCFSTSVMFSMCYNR
jgi:hypothetical protein